MEAVRIDPHVYESHYRWRREQGWPGWFPEGGLDQVLDDLRGRLRGVSFPGPRVLEVGCGAGDQSLALADLGFDVTGVDISPTAIEWALQKAEARGLAADFRLGDVRRLSDLGDGAFDWVLDGNCWHFVIGEGRAGFLASVYRVLRPGGLFLFHSVCNDPGPLEGYLPDLRVQVIEGVAVTYFGRDDDLLAELREAGFAVERHETVFAKGPTCSDFLNGLARKPGPV